MKLIEPCLMSVYREEWDKLPLWYRVYSIIFHQVNIKWYGISGQWIWNPDKDKLWIP